ncbi:restriction endonuclease subunit S [Glaesserella parasuis]|uniref:restriction endonuclease subunit S n=1 Tax=Glaesserella parasuis TaxID=738 RepID=UPI0024365E77|nr:restriction endonuclease subunit S [Glaesserella parasuis]MDG6377124.1 restriction endonuclease subunit S [Glaesserella parasuis]
MKASEQNKPNQQERVLPKLRFPEFQTALGWSWKTLDQVCTITNGKSNAQDHIENGKYPLFDRSEIIKASNDYLFDCEVVIIPGEGMKFIPKYYKGKFNLHQRAYALKNFIINGKFVYYSMLNNTTLLSKKAVQSTVLSLRLPILKNFPIIKPETEEQQKIADCLSSLDELIELQEQKLVALKQHKKGLMQQLFPSHNDLQASKQASKQASNSLSET